MRTEDLVHPEFFSRLESLKLQAQAVVEGFLHGLHRSPYVGFSVEFSGNRPYAPGDDPRYVNWKIFARQHRWYVKQFDAETNMNLYLLLDVSASMRCAHAGLTKLRYGAALSAALAHLALRQNDAVGITLFADEVLDHVSPRARPHQLDEILHAIVRCDDRRPSRWETSMRQAAQLASHRGMVVIVSDLFDDVDAVMRGLEMLRFKKHEVLVFHVLDPRENELSLSGNHEFLDLETGETLTTHAGAVAEDYRTEVRRWKHRLDEGTRTLAVERVEALTSEPMQHVLLDYLVKRTRGY
jgi:uncharacterized protein (DUF58 family)